MQTKKITTRVEKKKGRRERDREKERKHVRHSNNVNSNVYHLNNLQRIAFTIVMV